MRDWIPRLARMSAAQRARLRGVSQPRARQILAGAVVAHAVSAAGRPPRSGSRARTGAAP
ncbi:hypothetical protein [Lentzea atacamensis]|uniref:hypothetical protein n=1 Tax=Lentzea atacamensis TaxID=531938 RepID=UPI00398A3B55